MNENDKEMTFLLLKASDLASKTLTTYSAITYGYKEWLKIIAFLLDFGLTRRETEIIVRSKHTRWAANTANSEIVSAEVFFDYFEEHKDQIIAMLNKTVRRR